MIDKHIIEPTGTGVILNHRRVRHTAEWKTIRYTVKELETLIPRWEKGDGCDDAAFLADMKAAFELEKELGS
jgi:hypothetical protein